MSLVVKYPPGQYGLGRGNTLAEPVWSQRQQHGAGHILGEWVIVTFLISGLQSLFMNAHVLMSEIFTGILS